MLPVAFHMSLSPDALVQLAITSSNSITWEQRIFDVDRSFVAETYVKLG